MPLIVCTARKIPPTASRAAGSFSHSSRRWLYAVRWSRLSLRKRSAYWRTSTQLPEHALDGLEHARGLERLDHEILRARLDGLDHEGLLPHGAAHQDLGVGIAL